jgi:hypothetical protein
MQMQQVLHCKAEVTEKVLECNAEVAGDTLQFKSSRRYTIMQR